MPISTQIKIEIAGETLTRFSKLVIDQKVHTHHRFSLLQPLPKEFVSQAIDKAQGYIGQAIKITINPSNMMTASPLTFNGIITEAQMVRTDGASGGIIINGFSPTILLEGTPNTKSYTDKSLADIVQEVTGNYSADSLKPAVSVQKDASLPYTVQYSESDFSFLCRIAQKKGQWFYFNGEELVFGKPKSKNFTLEYGRSLHSFNIEMRAKSLGFEYVGYDPSNGETQRASSSEANYQPEGYSKSVFESSKKLFPNSSTMLYFHSLEEGNSKTHLTDRVTTQLQSRAADLVTAKGDSDETGLRIGDVINIKEPAFSLTGNLLDGLQEQNFGSYIITDIMHICDESGNYHNTFDAVPDTVVSPPYGNVHSFPVAESQPATVISNDDPAGLGRIQVAFAWQKDSGANTPWIRMTNPHSGGGKGFYFIPEVGEEVLVGFEGGNAEKPFVLGAMYNGSALSEYHTSGNDKKVIQTRSGTKVIMNDAEGSIFIEDPSGNTWLMDGKGNINVNAPKNMTFTIGENFNISVGKDMITNIGENRTTNVTLKDKLQAQEAFETIDQNKTVKVSGDLKESTGTTTHKAEQGDIFFQSAGVAKVLGAIDAKVNKG
ncbi:type VI secretion system Vgr family protein [Flavobacterium lindanitolerans]|uniref:Rhs element Vgr protein n=1 Tax=Flavobacterium lindanitolerans TaxID=428988 RepID=A0A497UVV5_9FLAO|nr:phage baseplate assembly protein V [Flavobacterium lindanitolerans]PKW29268.1 Rhs element Vgr protein [Flavobacterium lindanitolerans]RLJ35231.1 Rhs element Vgr protein [Flavobacterium lindanitolerans]